MNNAVFGKTIENLRKCRDIKLVTIEARRNYLMSELNHHTTKFCILLAIEMRKTQILMNKPAYLGLSILELSKIVIYKFCNDYVKPKYHGKTNLRYKYTESFIDLVNTDDIYKYIAKDVETRSDTSNFALKKPLLKGSMIKK